MDPLEFNEDEVLEERKRLLMDAFGRLDDAAMRALEQWFCNEFGIHQAAFRVVDDGWNALDAMRQDAFRLVWLSMRRAWGEVKK